MPSFWSSVPEAGGESQGLIAYSGGDVTQSMPRRMANLDARMAF